MIDDVLMIEPRTAAALILRAERMSAETVQAKIDAAAARRAGPLDPAPVQVVDGSAIVNVNGILSPAPTFWGQLFGDEITHDQVRSGLQAAADDRRAERIVMAIDSPGGLAAGLSRFTQDVAAVDRIKPLYAYSEGMMTSAAYWLATSARMITAAPEALIGSIGAKLTIYDVVKAFDAAGIKVDVFTSGAPLKAAGEPGTSLSTEQREAIQRLVDDTGAIFRDAVQRRRSFSDGKMRDIGRGGVYVAPRALREALIDRVDTIDRLLNDLSGRGRGDGRREPAGRI